MGREAEIESRSIEVGEGNQRYRVVEGWPQLPEGMTFEEVVAVASDSQGRVYVFNRGHHPIMTFDRTGQFTGGLAAGTFARPHGITMGPDDTIYCVDDFDHTVKVVSKNGMYDKQVAQDDQGEPTFVDRSFDDVLNMAFGDRIIDTSDHAALLALLGAKKKVVNGNTK